MNQNLIDILDKVITLYNKQAKEDNRLELYEIRNEVDFSDDEALENAIKDILENIQ